MFRGEVCGLSVTSVNAILSSMASNITSRPAGGTLHLSLGTNAAPTGQGLLDQAKISTKPWTITTNNAALNFTTSKQLQSWTIKVTTGNDYTIDWGNGTYTTTTGNGADQVITKDYGSAATRNICFIMADYTKLLGFNCDSNQLSGTLPSFAACTNLVDFRCASNLFTGTLPSFAACTELVTFYCISNSFSGTLPSFAACTKLTSFGCYVNTFSGTVPSFPNTITGIQLNNNTFSGTLPSFANCTGLVYFSCHVNAFTDYTSQTIATTCTTWRCETNQFPATAINAMLANMVTNLASRPTGGTMNLSGVGNAAPTGQGITDKGLIAAKPWTVTTN